jgi:hypothetical protein
VPPRPPSGSTPAPGSRRRGLRCCRTAAGSGAGKQPDRGRCRAGCSSAERARSLYRPPSRGPLTHVHRRERARAHRGGEQDDGGHEKGPQGAAKPRPRGRACGGAGRRRAAGRRGGGRQRGARAARGAGPLPQQAHQLWGWAADAPFTAERKPAPLSMRAAGSGVPRSVTSNAKKTSVDTRPVEKLFFGGACRGGVWGGSWGRVWGRGRGRGRGAWGAAPRRPTPARAAPHHGGKRLAAVRPQRRVEAGLNGDQEPRGRGERVAEAGRERMAAPACRGGCERGRRHGDGAGRALPRCAAGGGTHALPRRGAACGGARAAATVRSRRRRAPRASPPSVAAPVGVAGVSRTAVRPRARPGADRRRRAGWWRGELIALRVRQRVVAGRDARAMSGPRPLEAAAPRRPPARRRRVLCCAPGARSVAGHRRPSSPLITPPGPCPSQPPALGAFGRLCVQVFTSSFPARRRRARRSQARAVRCSKGRTGPSSLVRGATPRRPAPRRAHVCTTTAAAPMMLPPGVSAAKTRGKMQPLTRAAAMAL